MSDPRERPLSISIRDLHVRYRVFADRQLTAVELARRGFRSRTVEEVHALRGVSFDVHEGEAVGLIGTNGSGKSTLLRCVAGVQAIESGEVLVGGSAQLLGVSAALEKKLSGWRNVWLGGLAMGMSREEIEVQIDSVRKFSGLAEAFDRPVNTYSSGMRARLAFSIATMSQPDILLVDEALAVGDRRFKRRSLAKIRQICEDANTVLMVTHNLREIHETCPRTIWLADGSIVQDGPTDDVLSAYTASDSDD